MHPRARRGARPGEEAPRAELPLTPPSHPCGTQGAFIFGPRAAHLPQSVRLGGLAHRLSETVALASRACALLKEHHVMPGVAGESIRTGAQHARDVPRAALVPQAIQSRPVQGRTTLAIIAEDRLGMERLPFACAMEPQALALVVHGWGEGLTIGRHPDIDSAGHTSPPMVRAEQWTGWECRSAGSAGSMAGEIDRRGPTVAWRRPPPETDAVSARGVAWYPPG